VPSAVATTIAPQRLRAMSAYRKLGVHTRSEAIVTARRAGLLPGA